MMSGMDKQQQPRKSGRSNIGQPPSRLGFNNEAAAPVKKPASKKAKSKASSTGSKRAVEAEKDEMVAKRNDELAEKATQAEILKVRISSCQKRLDAAKTKNTGTPNATSQQLISELEDSLLNLEEEYGIKAAELKKLEATQEGVLRAINSRYLAEMEKIESGDDDSSLDEDVVTVRTQQCAAGQQQETFEDFGNHDELPASTLFDDPVVNAGNMEAYKPYEQPCFPTAPYVNGGNTMVFKSEQPPLFTTVHPLTRNLRFEERQRRQDPPRRPPQRKLNGGEVEEESEEEKAMQKLALLMGNAIGNAMGGSGIQSGGSRSGLDHSLPKFNGNPGDWENFKAEYLRTYKRYQDSENICRLRSSLGGDAYQAVKHLMANPNNIDKMLSSLQLRFGRPELVLDYLVEQAKVTKSPDPAKPQTLIDFGTAVEALYVNVCAYNETDYLGNRQLVTELAGKLPLSLQTEWHRWLLSDSRRKPNLTYFAEWLAVEVSVAIMAVKPKVVQDVEEEERRRGRFRAHGRVNIVSGETEDECCSCCGKGNHTTSKCWKFQKLSTKDRWDTVKEKAMCLCCLKQGHQSKKCPVAAKCPQDRCTYYHHILLHSDQRKADYGNQDESNVNSRTSHNGAGGTGMFNTAIVTGTDGPLQIIPVRIKKANGNGYIKVHALLDGGATRSMMLKSLANELGLDGKEVGSYKYSGINGETTSVEGAVKLNCDVAGDGAGYKYHACYGVMTVDKIPLQPYSFDADKAVKQYPHLWRLKGKSLKWVVPQIIIGNNNTTIYPLKIVTGREGEPCALKTVFGWTVGGNFSGNGTGSINIAMGPEGVNHSLQHPETTSMSNIEVKSRDTRWQSGSTAKRIGSTGAGIGNTQRIKYGREELLEVGNQALAIFKVPEAIVDIAIDRTDESKTRKTCNLTTASGTHGGNVQHGILRGTLELGGKLSGPLKGIKVTQQQDKGGWVLGPMCIPPPPPPSTIPSEYIGTASKEKRKFHAAGNLEQPFLNRFKKNPPAVGTGDMGKKMKEGNWHTEKSELNLWPTALVKAVQGSNKVDGGRSADEGDLCTLYLTSSRVDFDLQKVGQALPVEKLRRVNEVQRIHAENMKPLEEEIQVDLKKVAVKRYSGFLVPKLGLPGSMMKIPGPADPKFGAGNVDGRRRGRERLKGVGVLNCADGSLSHPAHQQKQGKTDEMGHEQRDEIELDEKEASGEEEDSFKSHIYSFYFWEPRCEDEN